MKGKEKKVTNDKPVYLFPLAFFEAIITLFQRKSKPKINKDKDVKPKQAGK